MIYKPKQEKEPIWMVLRDQEVEEWNLGTTKELETSRVNNNLLKKLKSKTRAVFIAYKDVFSWDHDKLKGVDPKVCQH